MTLVGKTLGAYEVIAKLGEGGMGEVYRARDTRLDRDVAIKVLPPHLSADPDALGRFEREAKAVAALSHPNILAIHEFGRDAATGVSYAAMELLEGHTLRERLSDGAIPPKKVVQLGADVASGLAAAHARGVVHRDLKPENIFVTADGRVKILDFGLARSMALASNDADSPTALRRTDPGTVLGTVGYMSPEQVKGQPADQRSDIFSLGCVLYELATGRRAFHRDTAAETMTAILREDVPDLTRESGAAPAGLESIIRHCLEKQPDERFQSARDLAFALQSASGATTPSGAASGVGAMAAVSPAAAAGASRAKPWGWIVTAVLAAAAAFAAGRFLSAGAAPALDATYTQITDDAGAETQPVISPDGASVAFVSDRRGSPDIFVQRVGGRNALVVAGDPSRAEGAPAFSPDGSSVAFHESHGVGGIFIAGATGESARRVTDFGFHPSWSPDGLQIAFCTEGIVFPESRTSQSALWVVDAKGGTPRKISDGDVAQPVWSPSGARIAYWAVDTGQRDIFTMPAAGGERVPVTSDAALDWNPQWSPDGRYLYFSTDRSGSMNIWRVPIDQASGKAGTPEAVTSGAATSDSVSLSHDGHRLVFRSVHASANPAALAFDPVAETIGALRPLIDRSGSMAPTDVSPDGQWLALWNLLERQEDVFLLKTDGSELRRLTDDLFRDRAPVFSPDGKELTFYSNRSNTYNIYSVRIDGSAPRAITERAGNNDQNLLYPVYSPDGARLIASRVRAPETFFLDPRKAAKDQTFEKVDTRLPDGSWLLPTGWSPDGKYWGGVVIKPSGSRGGLAVYDVAGRKVRLVVDGVMSSFFGFVWVDNRRLLTTQANALSIADVETGRVKNIPVPATLGPGVAASADRRTLYVSTTRAQADVWLATLKER